MVLLNSPLSSRWVTALELATNECCARSGEPYKATGPAGGDAGFGHSGALSRGAALLRRRLISPSRGLG